MSTSTPDILAAVDRHLAAIPAGRETLTVDEHRDVLLDLRTMISPGVEVEPGPTPVPDADPTEMADPLTETDVETDPGDFPDEIAADDVIVDPALTGLDLALEVDLAAEARADDFPDADLAEDFAEDMAFECDGGLDAEPAAADEGPGESDVPAAPEPEAAVEPEPERVPLVHLRLATSARGVIGRCGLMVDIGAGDSSTPWTEEVTCGACVDAVAAPEDDSDTTVAEATKETKEAKETDAPEPGASDANDSEAADSEAQPVGAVADIPDDGEESWVHADDDADGLADAPLIHQLAEVEGSGHGKNKIAKAPCGHVETSLKTEAFAVSTSWPEDVTCPDCIARRHQAQPDQAAA